MPKTIDIPRRGRYSYLSYYPPKNKYFHYDDYPLNRRELREGWEGRKKSFEIATTIKPIYLKYENLFWKIFAIDWEAKEMLIVEEADEKKIPNDLPDDVANFVRTIIEHNKTKLLFKHYKDER